MQINVSNNVKVNWTDPATSLNGPDGVGKSEVGKEKRLENLSLSDGTELEGGQIVGNTPDIDVPQASDTQSENLNGIVEKLEGDDTFDLTDDELKELNNNLKSLLEKPLASSNTGKTEGVSTPSTSSASHSSQVFFDIYQMLALLAECAQEQKNAARDIRKAETETMVTSIQNQADMQKSAALTGLIAGSIVCTLQAGVAIGASIKTVSNIKASSNLSTELGVKSAATEVSTAQNELKTNVDALKNFEQEHPAPEPNVDEAAELQQQRADLKAKVDDSKAKVIQKRADFRAAREVMSQDTRNVKIEISEARTKAVSDVNMAVGNLGQNIVKGFVDLQQAEATGLAADQKRSEEGLDESKELMSSFQETIDQLLKLAQAILQAENQSMRDAIQA